MEKVLELIDLHTYFFTRRGVAKAVCGVGFGLSRGEILGVVGESGSGKSVTALSILRLVPHPGRIVRGRVILDGRDLTGLSIREMRGLRGDRISMIFQEPMISLNPAFTIGHQLMEALRVHRRLSRSEARERAVEMLTLVEIPDAEKRLRDYPHHLSGGMRQRVMIAEALLLGPDVLLADEPTTALDVTVQAQVLDLMANLNRETGTAIMLITHNLGLVAEWARRVVVMYAGRVVEEGPVAAIFEEPRHPYTRGLLRSIPQPGAYRGRGTRDLYEMKGIVPSLVDLHPGCPFHPRCPEARDICGQEEPPFRSFGPDHRAACWLEG